MYDIAVLGGDIRQVYMVSLFHEANLSVITYGLTHPIIEDSCTQGTSIKEAIKSSMVLVSAIPFSRDGITIPSLTAASDMNVTQFTSHACCNQTLFAGMLSPSIKSFCQQNQINYYDFMEDDAVAIANGIATAEGAIMEAIARSSGNLHGSCCLLLGFGRCGKTLAMKLKGLDAKVSIAARKSSDLALANALGFHPLSFDVLKETIGTYDYIFNSIPAFVLDSCLLSQLSKEAVIIDIASHPGGLDHTKAKELGINASLCLGIPGKVSPKASAKILADMVLSHIK